MTPDRNTPATCNTSTRHVSLTHVFDVHHRLPAWQVSSGPDTLCGIVSSTDVVFGMLCGDDDDLDDDIVDQRLNEDRQGHAASAY